MPTVRHPCLHPLPARLLGLAVSRFARGRTWRLSIGRFYFGGTADIRLRLSVGPVRELRISRIALRLSTRPSDDGAGTSAGASAGASGGSAALWQALLSGQLLLPVSLHGVSVRLAAAPAAAVEASAAELPAAAPAPAPAGARRAPRQRRAPPLHLLGYLPLLVEGLQVLDEVRSSSCTRGACQ